MAVGTISGLLLPSDKIAAFFALSVGILGIVAGVLFSLFMGATPDVLIRVLELESLASTGIAGAAPLIGSAYVFLGAGISMLIRSAMSGKS